ncbi:hypothetical protein AX14_004723 [Amanita brunnescens Koide BX004]|nr:hypothetical protein AX14_004723 [Amanita brunnescens Koide BX004]
MQAYPLTLAPDQLQQANAMLLEYMSNSDLHEDQRMDSLMTVYDVNNADDRAIVVLVDANDLIKLAPYAAQLPSFRKKICGIWPGKQSWHHVMISGLPFDLVLTLNGPQSLKEEFTAFVSSFAQHYNPDKVDSIDNCIDAHLPSVLIQNAELWIIRKQNGLCFRYADIATKPVGMPLPFCTCLATSPTYAGTQNFEAFYQYPEGHTYSGHKWIKYQLYALGQERIITSTSGIRIHCSPLYIIAYFAISLMPTTPEAEHQNMHAASRMCQIENMTDPDDCCSQARGLKQPIFPDIEQPTFGQQLAAQIPEVHIPEHFNAPRQFPMPILDPGLFAAAGEVDLEESQAPDWIYLGLIEQVENNGLAQEELARQRQAAEQQQQREWRQALAHIQEEQRRQLAEADVQPPADNAHAVHEIQDEWRREHEKELEADFDDFLDDIGYQALDDVVAQALAQEQEPDEHAAQIHGAHLHFENQRRRDLQQNDDPEV